MPDLPKHSDNIMRKPIFAANWKMNKGPSETEDFVRSFLSKLQGVDLPCEIVIAPPFVSLQRLADLLHSATADQNAHAIQIAAQNCSQYDAGAYTGEVSVLMLREFFVHALLNGREKIFLGLYVFIPLLKRITPFAERVEYLQFDGAEIARTRRKPHA